MARVAEIAAHRAYHFPAAGLQLTTYLAWLIRNYGGRPLREAQAADAKAREAMAANPRVFQTALDWELLCRANERPPSPDTRRQRSAVCQNFLSGRCHVTPCPWLRVHPACRICRLGDHPTERHADVAQAQATPLLQTATRPRQLYQPYPPRGRVYRR